MTTSAHMASKIRNELHRGRLYKVLNGTWYTFNTPDHMVILLESLRLSQTRVRFHWGDTSTGRDWGDIFDVTGRVGRSMGPVKAPLLIYNRRSSGGGVILSDCIVKITTSEGKETIYQHKFYNL